MSSIVKKICSLVLLGVFTFYITPKEILHVFTHHIDSKHEAHSASSKGFLQYSGEHHHCELLKADQQFNAVHFNFSYYQVVLSVLPSMQPIHDFYEEWVQIGYAFIQPLRGPPVC